MIFTSTSFTVILLFANFNFYRTGIFLPSGRIDQTPGPRSCLPADHENTVVPRTAEALVPQPLIPEKASQEIREEEQEHQELGGQQDQVIRRLGQSEQLVHNQDFRQGGVTRQIADDDARSEGTSRGFPFDPNMHRRFAQRLSAQGKRCSEII
jgi:hypothetical protein